MDVIQFDESDQAGIFSELFSSHLEKHNGIPDNNCVFCKNFIIQDKENKEPLSTYRFIIIDFSNNGE